MKTLSACLIVKNEELVIERCIKSLCPIADEIIVVDTGSIDNTLGIINNLIKDNNCIKLYHFKWIDDFSAARNFSFEKAMCDYIMWVDSDEVFTDDLNHTLLNLKENDFNNCDVIATNIKFFYSENDYNVVMRERILLRANEPIWKFRVHELLLRNTTLDKDDSMLKEYLIPFNNGYVFHEKKKESNFKYYFQIYCDELNKNELELSHHNLYYLTWMCSYYDNIMAKNYAYDVFMNLPLLNYDIDYREWFKHNILTENEYIILMLLSYLNTSISDGPSNYLNTNMIDLFNKSKKLYEKGEFFGAYYGFNFLLKNAKSFFSYKKYEEKIYEYMGIILWNINLFTRFLKMSKKFFDIYPNNEIAKQNYCFTNYINNEINNTSFIINLNNNKWNLPHLLFLIKDLPFKNKFIINNSKDVIDNIVDTSFIEVKDLSKIETDAHNYMLINDNSNIENNFIFLMKDFLLNKDKNFEIKNKNYIFTKNKEKILNFLN